MDHTTFAAAAGLSRLENPALPLFDWPAPPAYNTGARNTSQVQVGLDYLRFSAAREVLTDVLQRLGGAEEWIAMDHGHYGYTSGLRCGEAVVYHSDGREDICVQLGGLGCMDLRSRGVADESLLMWALSIAKNITRLDFAFDSFGRTLRLADVEASCAAGHVTTRFKTYQPVEKRRIGDASPVGRTLYMGSRQSDSMLRFYDKGLQTGDLPAGSWIRTELELKNERAHLAAELIASRGIVAAAGLLADVVDFKDAGSDSNRSRWRRVAWWDAFLGCVERMRLGVAVVPQTVAKVIAHLKRQYGPTLSALLKGFQGDASFIYEIADDGNHRQRAKHRLLTAAATSFAAA